MDRVLRMNQGGAVVESTLRGPFGGRRRTILAGALGGVILASLVLFTACGGGEGEGVSGKPAAGPAAVSVEQAAERPWAEGMAATAGLQPFRRAMPGTVLMGRVEQVLHQEGDRVKSGELLARVESRDVSARLAQAEAAVAAAKAQEENARRTRDRILRLSERQAASPKNLDDATAGYEGAVAGLKAAEEGVAAARVMLGYSRITSPFDGVVTEKKVEAGDTAAPGMPLFVVEDTSKMKLEAPLPESWLPRLKVGEPVEVVVESVAELARQGTIAEILPTMDSRSRTFLVRVVLDNADGALRSGMFARLRIGGAERPAVAVPESALVRRGPLSGIFVVDASGTARLRWITLGDAREGRVEVLTGLKAGERFVTVPPPDLEDGRKVGVK